MELAEDSPLQRDGFVCYNKSSGMAGSTKKRPPVWVCFSSL
uniref:Uncharacterized protein n=1 Tax=Peronospora matthiolae TaxID=2874970 RepID=A0AAV1US35_9STRA